MEQERLSKGIWIPIEVWKDKNLTWNEKILFLEIDSYTSSEKDCFFSNEYISDLLGISVTNASKTISSLIEKGYVIKTKFDGRKRYVKTALSYTTSLHCQQRQPSYTHDNNINNNNIETDNNTSNKEKEIDLSISKRNKELFEECWLAYNRKGSKKKALEQWQKINDETKGHILTHIKAYVGSRDRQFQKDFERYLRDKTFNDIVYKGNSVIFDPMVGMSNAYMPATDGAIKWNETNKCYIYIGMFFGYIPDGYTDDNRPNGATITLNNGRGTITWNSETKTWEKK